uniref:Amidohydrolase family protein n=1 Tax=Bosea sp. NBC_00436 TaxID=2969620 RepID=A0A9E8CJP1_9HYPH
MLEPQQPIVDAHHHLYDRPGLRYLLDEFEADLRSGHDVRATVLVQARASYRPAGPAASQPLGETEAAMRMAASGARAGVAAGIVGYADLTLGDAVRPVLEEHIRIAGGTTAAGGRMAGIRHITAWDPEPSLFNPAYPASEDLMDSTGFRAGFAHLGALGLSFDAWVYFHQLPRLARLARNFPAVPIIVDHCGGVLGTGPYARNKREVFELWSRAMRDLAGCPNITVKLGGLGMPLSGFGFETQARRPTSPELAKAWRPVIETCIEALGPARCMFESNFPPDRVSYSYATGWNAMKRLVARAGSDEKDALFWRTACRVYGLRPAGLASL